jgi:hypothetical protein
MSVARAEDRAPWRHDPSADPGAKTEGGRHDAALSFPFGIGTKAANRPSLFQCTLYLISRPWFLHFTLNHHSRDHSHVSPARPSVNLISFDSHDCLLWFLEVHQHHTARIFEADDKELAAVG